MIEVVPVTVPIPLLRLSDVAFATTQERVLVFPTTIDAGLAVNDVMVGAGASVVAWTLPDCAEALPDGS